MDRQREPVAPLYVDAQAYCQQISIKGKEYAYLVLSSATLHSFLFISLLNHPARASFWLLDWRGRKKAPFKPCQPFEAPTLNLVLSRQIVFFFACEHPFIDEPMVITEPAVASARPLGLGSKLYPSNIPGMRNKGLTRFLQNHSREHQNWASEMRLCWQGLLTPEYLHQSNVFTSFSGYSLNLRCITATHKLKRAVWKY